MRATECLLACHAVQGVAGVDLRASALHSSQVRRPPPSSPSSIAATIVIATACATAARALAAAALAAALAIAAAAVLAATLAIFINTAAPVVVAGGVVQLAETVSGFDMSG